MTKRKAANGLDFSSLRLGIERCDPNLVLGFYADGVTLSIVNVKAPHAPPFELSGKAEIAKHLRVVFTAESSHRVEREVVGENRVTFRETCQYPDGDLVRVETTLEVHDGEIVRQVDVVANEARADLGDEIGRRLPFRKTQPRTGPGVDELPSGGIP
jgi:SnoaL-like domain